MTGPVEYRPSLEDIEGAAEILSLSVIGPPAGKRCEASMSYSELEI